MTETVLTLDFVSLEEHQLINAPDEIAEYLSCLIVDPD